MTEINRLLRIDKVGKTNCAKSFTPVRAGIVEKASQYIYSSASNYVNDKGLLTISKAGNPIVSVLDLSNMQRYNSY